MSDFAVFGAGYSGTYSTRADALTTLENNKNQGKIYIKLDYAEKMAQAIKRVIIACDAEHLDAHLPLGLRRELGECLDALR